MVDLKEEDCQISYAMPAVGLEISLSTVYQEKEYKISEKYKNIPVGFTLSQLDSYKSALIPELVKKIASDLKKINDRKLVRQGDLLK